MGIGNRKAGIWRCERQSRFFERRAWGTSAITVAVMVLLFAAIALPTGADPVFATDLAGFFDKVASKASSSVYFSPAPVVFADDRLDQAQKRRLEDWFIIQVKVATQISRMVTYIVVKPENAVDRTKSQYELSAKVKKMGSEWSFEVDIVEATTGIFIAPVFLSASDKTINIEMEGPAMTLVWSEHFDSPQALRDWEVGTNQTKFPALENWTVSAGALRQTKPVTSLEDPVSKLWSSGYSALRHVKGYKIERLMASSVIEVVAEVVMGARDPWLTRIGVVSFGFAWEHVRPDGQKSMGTFWLQNAFGRETEQLDWASVLGIVIDGKEISTEKSDPAYEGFSKPLTDGEIGKSQARKKLVFRIRLEIETGCITGSILYPGDREDTIVASQNLSEITAMEGGSLIIRPIPGCTGTVCAFDAMSISIR